MILLSSVGKDIGKSNWRLFSAVLTKPVKQIILYSSIIKLFSSRAENLTESQNKNEHLPSNLAERYPLRILIAEDNPINQQLALMLLTKMGYEPALAENGQEALDKQRGGNYDIIFMDVQMPEMDGLEATKTIRKQLETQPIIIAMTANAMQGDKEDCICAGMNDYISKPFKPQEVALMLEKWAS